MRCWNRYMRRTYIITLASKIPSENNGLERRDTRLSTILHFTQVYPLEWTSTGSSCTHNGCTRLDQTSAPHEHTCPSFICMAGHLFDEEETRRHTHTQWRLFRSSETRSEDVGIFGRKMLIWHINLARASTPLAEANAKNERVQRLHLSIDGARQRASCTTAQWVITKSSYAD